MSICDGDGRKVDLITGEDRHQALRDAVRALDVAGTRRFLVNLLHGCGMPMARVAKVMHCSTTTARRDGLMPDADEAGRV